ncbi:CHAT domain-containing protein [Dactylosporangium fulvum]|uniref:CHAT domain-containing protein n=1 Tax=Dactylosporangium fulvum TaxID=53359 RepID=A0ABY5W185_9ACTN|nr:CHAT domain-containing protein [Dactylosporangium fulvum]UWP83190.1 CHAT domain-containing protein [Dactylosporangium fulvum]
MFEEPWAHDARGHRLRHDLRSADPYQRTRAEIELPVWAYREARLRGDDPGADAAWQVFRQTRQQQRDRADDWWAAQATHELVSTAAAFDDIDRAVREVLEWHPRLDTRDLENDNTGRTDVRTFVSACTQVLSSPASAAHPQRAVVRAALRDIEHRAGEWLSTYNHDEIREIDDIYAIHESGNELEEESVTNVVTGGLPAIAGGQILDLAGAALTALETNDDTAALSELVRRLEQTGEAPSLLHLLQARRAAATGALPAALHELQLAARATDPLAPRLLPQIHATAGTLQALHDPAELDEGIAACRTGRQSGVRWWRRTTAADAALARLLLWRALLPDTPPDRRAADVREAVRLARRRCRPWHHPSVDERVVLHDARAARDALSGGDNTGRQRRAWRSAVTKPSTVTEQARLALAWATWAVGTGDQELAAEAYQHLVGLVPLDAAARYGQSAKQRVLAAAQEHTAEAGYWLARTRRYREAVVALETGRAIGLSEANGRDDSAVHARLRAAGQHELAEEYRLARAEVDQQERHPSARPGHAWQRLRDVAARAAEVLGTDPLALSVSYADITAATGDGALVYIAAAKAGGYALVVAARHDPQFIELRTLDRRTVARLVAELLPLTRDGATVRGAEPVRDLRPTSRAVDRTTSMLSTLWKNGVHDLVLHSVRGRVVTFVPVGQLSLLPLHAAGEPGTPGDTYTEWRRAGHFSAIRYAPNARGLRRCQATVRALPSGEQRLLAVDVADAAGGGAHLPHVARETTGIARCWPGAVTIAHNCTWQRFQDTADEHTVWHLACHGSAQPHSILDSRLYFADRQVTLKELRDVLRPGQRRLAVLSACESNLTGTALPNEVVGLPSALLQVGFAGVIASSWKVDDLATAYLMTAFHRQWREEGHEPVVALNHAMQWLRTATRDDLAAMLPDVEPGGDAGPYPYLAPRYWAAFAYTGA